MTHKQRAIMALTMQKPDYVPTFELEYQLSEEVFGGSFLKRNDLKGLSPAEKERRLAENAEFLVKVYSEMEHSIIPIHYLQLRDIIATAKYIKKLVGDEFLLTAHGDGTFSIPSGDKMEEFIYWLADDPEDAKKTAQKKADEAVERNKRLLEGGIESFILCSDYCFNKGPFLSPSMFAEFVAPYLYKIIYETKKAGGYCIKHTDGDIMPILDQLAQCRPNAIHSLDPMAGVDIKVIKEMIGKEICLCGNVNCALMQTGTDEEVAASAEYCLTHGKPGGGYIYCTSNVPFKGLDPKRYQLVMDIWKKHRYYDGEQGQ